MILGVVGVVNLVVFVVAVAVVAIGGVGLVSARQPVHAALFLVLTLFGVAILFIQEGAQFLAAVQVVVYAGAVVVLFLFVIMLLGVDRVEVSSIVGSGWRVWAAGIGVAAVLVELGLLAIGHEVTGASSLAGKLSAGSNLGVLARSVFTTYVLPFELTSVLLVIAVIGAVVLARRLRQRSDATTVSRSEEVHP
ncbi:NADH-ubiquinone/plastoquinone oxidoreductase chain 6 [Acidimicrobium ferrooxidans DSM 10331]|uniref:NADH-quinone oxidoreductase subunit J n=1 Tax=Acidimicrobium ferrooxidans (strain DSM 10331 / JCM 15462 / NBRC 103882 / ICP) TaxID=525909 RepID=C7M2U6_ACIFD|nr:NADH-quinone oxidoreductase subunit J [Acidimicrobium ferrooxidans]ACU53340.1 NADH-ubiquinone/plastoquinone oxidoreductase chain 6 [Acidimicrobium ferrooxidans DSM 10331]